MKYHWTRWRAVAVVASAAFVLTGCATTEEPQNASPVPVASATPAPTGTEPVPTDDGPSTVAIPPVDGPHNDIDLMFVTDMIPHHRQAVEMAVMARTRAEDTRILDLAASIEQSQGDEITLMSGWLRSWGKKVPQPDQMHTAHGSGMLTHADMEDLKAAHGTKFDEMFVDMMIRHHEGAIEMAETTKENGKNPAVRALATNVVVIQAAEVAELTLIQVTL
ncbi:hypothetical protein GCM10009682_28090 [Luedemannella flava]|uniref:DUF305 domain-containing protein n=1 Tax=Luedemannella flava TaxID=349316 RepID=A0ABP4YDE8_9ACTN